MRTKLIVGAFAIAAIVGCTGSGSKLATCQVEKEQLLTTIRSQRDTARAQNEKLASVESRLDQAEKELARSGGSGTRLSSVPPRATDSGTSVKSNSLPWRSPSGSVEPSVQPAKESPRPGSSSS